MRYDVLPLTPCVLLYEFVFGSLINVKSRWINQRVMKWKKKKYWRNSWPWYANKHSITYTRHNHLLPSCFIEMRCLTLWYWWLFFVYVCSSILKWTSRKQRYRNRFVSQGFHIVLCVPPAPHTPCLGHVIYSVFSSFGCWFFFWKVYLV